MVNKDLVEHVVYLGDVVCVALKVMLDRLVLWALLVRAEKGKSGHKEHRVREACLARQALQVIKTAR